MVGKNFCSLFFKLFFRSLWFFSLYAGDVSVSCF
jgi:hypothetical protein